MNTATQTGAASLQPADPDVNKDEVVAKVNPRQAAIDAMAERQEKARVDDLNVALAADPGLAADHAAIESEIKELKSKIKELSKTDELDEKELKEIKKHLKKTLKELKSTVKKLEKSNDSEKADKIKKIVS